MRILERYVIREVLLPFFIALLVFTFILIIPFIIRYAEAFIAKGVPTMIVLKVMTTLLPQALALSIPAGLLIGLLVAFGRLSADREIVAMQACAVSVLRLLRPVGVISLAALAATSYVMLYALPDANQAFRELTYNIIASRAEGEVKPRVFFQDFPDLVVYVREIPPSGGWNDVFIADTRPGQPATIYVVRHGRVVLDATTRTVEMVLDDGTSHVVDANGTYKVLKFEHQILSVNPDAVFPRTGPQKGDSEMTIAELRQHADDLERAGQPSQNEIMAIHRKFSIPVACLTFGIVGLALGAANPHGGKLGSFVYGLGVIFAYYVPLYLGPAIAKAHVLSPWLATWLPNMILGIGGLALLHWRTRAADREFRIAVPVWLRRAALGAAAWFGSVMSQRGNGFGRHLPPARILDRYVASAYARVFLLCIAGMLALFYVSTFIDLAEKLARGAATWPMIGAYFWYLLPQYSYYVLPMAVLLGTLVTIGVLTKNSELVVMKACGISLFRIALPMVGAALLTGTVLFGLEQTTLGPSNQKADRLRTIMNGSSLDQFDQFTRQWMIGSRGEIYHYASFNPRTNTLAGLSIYEFSDGMKALTKHTYAERATFHPTSDDPAGWEASDTWTRELLASGDTRHFETQATRRLEIEDASFFGTRRPAPEYMSYSQLRDYIAQLSASGFNVVALQVALQRKVSFPFVTLIMTLIAVPFAVTTGRRGAMYGVGAGIVLAISYWIAFSIFAALGAGGVMTPLLAAWAPNLLFGAGAGYLLLTVRT